MKNNFKFLLLVILSLFTVTHYTTVMASDDMKSDVNIHFVISEKKSEGKSEKINTVEEKQQKKFLPQTGENVNLYSIILGILLLLIVELLFIKNKKSYYN